MKDCDYYSRIALARNLAGASGFTNTEAALSKLIEDHAEELRVVKSPSSVSVARGIQSKVEAA